MRGSCDGESRLSRRDACRVFTCASPSVKPSVAQGGGREAGPRAEGGPCALPRRLEPDSAKSLASGALGTMLGAPLAHRCDPTEHADKTAASRSSAGGPPPGADPGRRRAAFGRTDE